MGRVNPSLPMKDTNVSESNIILKFKLNDMKKFVILLFAAILFTSCDLSTVEKQPRLNESSMFVLIENTGTWKVVYHNETKVMYAISSGPYNQGTFTLLVDKDGKPLLYKGN